MAIRGPKAQVPIQAAELDRSRADLVQGLGAHLEDNHRLLNDLEKLFVYRLPNGYFTDYRAQVNAVTESEVSLETERFALEQMLGVVVGDAARLKSELEHAGFVVISPPNECLEE